MWRPESCIMQPRAAVADHKQPNTIYTDLQPQTDFIKVQSDKPGSEHTGAEESPTSWFIAVPSPSVKIVPSCLQSLNDNLKEILQKVSKTFSDSERKDDQEQDTIYLKVEENSELRQSEGQEER